MILNINKPSGWTSFDVVKKIRGIVKEKKVGHGGTLDPFATGVLIIGTGNDTKQLAHFTSEDKSYIATLALGKETNTHDTEGDIVHKMEIPSLTEENIELALHSFLGTTQQIPPMFSAKKVAGKRLYTLARKNIEIERNPVEIHIRDIQLISFDESSIKFSVTCSKGTYIRVLGLDIAKKLNTVGFLSALERTQVGGYSIDESQTIEEFQTSWTSSVN